jgi:hypothetical protein
MTRNLGATRFAFLLFGLAGTVSDGNHTLAAAEGKVRTSKTYTASLDQAITAITNAFSSCRYHDMGFMSDECQFDTGRSRWTKRPATNEWSLYPQELPVSVIARRKSTVPYYADFLITAEQHATNRCRITVATTSAQIPDGREIGIHGGWAVHMKDIAPILEEETNVLSRFERQLDAVQNGDFRPLLATPDTEDIPGYTMVEACEINPELGQQLLRAMQSETNAGLRQELLKRLLAVTNGAPR